MNPSKIIHTLTNKLSNNPLIRGFVLVGSQARQIVYKASKHSDMEAYIIVNDEDVEKIEKLLPILVKSLGNVIFSYKNQWSGFSTVFEDLFRLELPVIKISEINIVFSRPSTQEVRVIIDKTGGKLQAALDKRPLNLDLEKLFQEKVIDFWYMLILGVQYYKKGEIWNARSVLQILQSSLIKLFEILNNSEALLLETNKHVEKFLKPEQIKLLKEVSPAYEEKAIEESLKRIMKIFSEISEKIEKKNQFTYNKEVEKKVKERLLKLLE